MMLARPPSGVIKRLCRPIPPPRTSFASTSSPTCVRTISTTPLPSHNLTLLKRSRSEAKRLHTSALAFSTRPPQSASPPSSPTGDAQTTGPAKRKPSSSRSGDLVDEQIPYRLIRLVDPSDSSLLPPGQLRDVLRSLDRTKYKIALVDESQEVPICRIVDTKAEYEKEKARGKVRKEKRAATAAAAATGGTGPGVSIGAKELQMTWGVAEHDLKHKLEKGKEMLGRGYRVTMVITSKSDAKLRVTSEDKVRVEKAVLEQLLQAGKLVRNSRMGPGGNRLEIEVKP